MPMAYYDFIASHAVRFRERLAVVDLASGRQFTYAQLNARISRLAQHLVTACGITKGDRVAMLAHNSSNHLEVLFACGRIGAIFLPLNWRLTLPEMEYIVGDAEPKLLVHNADFRAQAQALLAGNNTIAACLETATADYENAAENALALVQPARLTLDDIQMIMYTSGTTGFPKGALLTFGMTFWNAVNLGLPAEITLKSRVLAVMPMCHTAGFNMYPLPALHAGGAVVVMRGFDAGAVLQALDDPELGITHLFAVPSAWQMMTEHPAFGSTNLSRIVTAGVGGSAPSGPLLEVYLARGIALQHGYGLTETSPSAATLAGHDAKRKLGSCGTPLVHTEMKVVRNDGTDADIDEPGELWMRGPHITPGYWRRPEATAEAFSGDWFRSGDIGRKDADGFFYVLDRAKDMYISGGENVYPAEIENVISKIPGVSAVAIVAITDAKWGEAGLAVIKLAPGAAVTKDQVLAHCQDRLARFKHPRDVAVIDDMPMTASGKIHKPSLRARFAKTAKP